MLKKQQGRLRRRKKIRAKIFGSATKPRLCVFRSSQHIYAQLINDEKNKTLASARDQELKLKAKTQKTKEGLPLAGKSAVAFDVGRLVAEKAKKIKIEKAVFDRGGYKYHGRIKALADGARAGGLKF